MSALRGLWPVYNFDLVRSLCQEIQREKDPQKITELLDLLRSLLADEREAAKLRLNYLVKKCADVSGSEHER